MNVWTMIFANICGGLAVTMNTWAEKWSDTYVSMNDVYMITLMTCVMMLVSILTEGSNHKGCLSPDHTSSTLPWIIYVGIGIITFYFIRQQVFVTDHQFLRGMIPHHSMAITMSKKIAERTLDPRIKDLATRIQTAQRNEINEMERLLEEQQS